MALVAAMSTTGCYEGPTSDTGSAWDPELGGSTGDDGDGDDADPTAEGDGSEDPSDPTDPTGSDGDESCDPLSSHACTCDDGSAGKQYCTPDGLGFGACQCEEPTDPGEDPPPTEEPPPAPEGQVCFLGEDRSGTTCFDVVAPPGAPDGYDYPAAYQGNPNYRPPVAFIDLDQVDGTTKVAPNFRLDEIAQRVKGQYALVQPHAVASLQELRDEVGAINVNSGYRSPAYNTQIGGATYSRHMYGDGFDLDPVTVGLSTLEVACTSHGGMLVEYDTHVHCDFRYDDVDPALFGDAAQAAIAFEPGLSAELEEEAGVFIAPALGFDEGEPKRRWSAYDEQGEQIAEGVGPVFVPPPDAVRVGVQVGNQLWLSRDV
jgi:hypothetical protein